MELRMALMAKRIVDVAENPLRNTPLQILTHLAWLQSVIPVSDLQSNNQTTPCCATGALTATAWVRFPVKEFPVLNVLKRTSQRDQVRSNTFVEVSISFQFTLLFH